MNFPSMLARTSAIAPCGRSGARWLLTCGGTPGWCMEFVHGVCVALAVERTDVDDAWLVRATLSIATLRGALDDGLLFDGEACWFVRRYALELDDTHFEDALAQQHAIVRWLTGKENRIPSFVGTRMGALG